MEKQYRKWSIIVVAVYAGLLFGIAVLVYVFDPYFHFHKPYSWVSYGITDDVYQNDGITKNFEYDAILTGTSMTRTMAIEDINELYEVNCVRCTFLGEGFRRINDNLITATRHNDRIRLVIRSVDPAFFVCGPEWLTHGSYDQYPTYLYNESPLDDVKYVYNLDVITKDLVPTIGRTIQRQPSDGFDMFDADQKGGEELVCQSYKRASKTSEALDVEETEMFMSALRENVKQNIVQIMKDNPDIRFVLFFPPYGTFYWDNLMQMGSERVERRFEMEQLVIEEILACENAELYSFLDCFDITTDLNNYVDSSHYTPKISKRLVEHMSRGEHRITLENYEEYLERSKEFYLNYDYDSVYKKFER